MASCSLISSALIWSSTPLLSTSTVVDHNDELGCPPLISVDAAKQINITITQQYLQSYLGAQIILLLHSEGFALQQEFAKYLIQQFSRKIQKIARKLICRPI